MGVQNKKRKGFNEHTNNNIGNRGIIENDSDTNMIVVRSLKYLYKVSPRNFDGQHCKSRNLRID